MTNFHESINTVVNTAIEKGEIIGANVLVLHKGREVHAGSYGMADEQKGCPMKRDTIFRMYSMTKPVTAVAVMILAERGMLDLWDPVAKYIPEYAEMQVYEADGSVRRAEKQIRIVDLLTMTSGMSYPDDWSHAGRKMDELFGQIRKELQAGNATDTLGYCRKMASVPLSFEPGLKWMYGTSADVCGGIVEVVSGMKFGDFLQKEIFGPLCMKDTGFVLPGEKKERMAGAYEWKEGKGLVPYTDLHLGLEGYEKVAFESGGAGLFSTIDDYAVFAKMLLGGGCYGGVRILSPKSVAMIGCDHLAESQKVDFGWDSTMGHGYGYLVRVMQDPGAFGTLGTPGEFGWDGWMGCYMTVDPADELILLYFIQRCGAGTSPEVRKLRNVVFAALTENA